MFSFSLGSPHFVHGNFYKIKHYITEVEKQNKFYEKRTVQNLYTFIYYRAENPIRRVGWG